MIDYMTPSPVQREPVRGALAAPLRVFRSAVTDLVETAIVLHGESARPDAAAVIGIGLIIAGVLVINLFSQTSPH